MTEHEQWLQCLSIRDRLIYDRAYGQAFFEGVSKELCQATGRKAVEKGQKD